jgi:hypothetical protein
LRNGSTSDGAYPFIGEYMKFHGKAISGTSLLTILGVLCFATVIVSAVVINSNTLTFTDTEVASPGSIALSATQTPSTIVLGNDAVYKFNANVPNALSGVVATVDIEASGITTDAITSATFQYDGGSITGLTFAPGATDHITASYSAGSQVIDSTVPCIVTIHYAEAGSYSVTVTMSGNA